jgi:ubiquitin carboxyl-terminal hydrolase L3
MESWVPLEANPEVMSKYVQRIGVPSRWELVDVLGLDDEQLSWVPKPVLAVLLLFPCSEQYEKHKREEDARLKADPPKVPDDVFYVKQTIRNACGTMALIHAVANNADEIGLEEGKFKQFLRDAKNLDPAARGALLTECQGVISAHTELANEGQSATPNADDPIYHHFVAFVHKGGRLYELDGSKSFPIDHGATTPETLLEDCAKICKAFMERDPADVNFTVIALATAQ